MRAVEAILWQVADDGDQTVVALRASCGSVERPP